MKQPLSEPVKSLTFSLRDTSNYSLTYEAHAIIASGLLKLLTVWKFVTFTTNLEAGCHLTVRCDWINLLSTFFMR